MKMYRTTIDSDKARKGFETYIELIEGEKLLLFCDDTIMGSGKEGAVLTDRRIVKFEKNKLQIYELAQTRDVQPLKLSGDVTSGLRITDVSGDIKDHVLAGIQSEDIDEFVTMARSILGTSSHPPTAKGVKAKSELAHGEQDKSAVEATATGPADTRGPVSVASCKHETKDQRCTNKPLPGKDFCFKHLPASEQAAYLEQIKKTISDGGSLAGACLACVDLRTVPLAGVDVSGADLTNAEMSKMNLAKTRFVGSNLEGAKLRKSNLSGADFTAARLHKTNMRSSTIDATIFRNTDGLETAAFNGSYLGDTSTIAPDLKAGIEKSANLLDLMTTFMVFVIAFAVLFGLVNLIGSFFLVAIPMGTKGIIVYFVVGWTLAAGIGGLAGAATGAIVGILPSLVIAMATKGKRSPHAGGGA